MSEANDKKFEEVIMDIDGKLSNDKVDTDIFDGKLKEYLEHLSTDLDKEKIKEVTRTRLTFLKEHIEGKFNNKSSADLKDKEKLLKEIDVYLENYEEAQNQAETYFSDLKKFGDNVKEDGKTPDTKKNAAGEEMKIPAKLLDIPVFKKYFLKTLEFLNKTFGGMFGNGFTDSILRSMNNSLSTIHLQELNKKDKLPSELKGLNISEFSDTEIRPFFGFFEELKIDVTDKEFWPNFFEGKLESNSKKIKLPERIGSKKVGDKFDSLEELYDYLNAIELSNPDLLKSQKEVTASFKSKLNGKEQSCYYRQYDPRWAHNKYGSKSMAASACGPTSFAMVATMLTGKEILPTEVAKWSLDKGHRVEGIGTDWNFMETAGKKYDIKATTLGKNESALLNSLKSGPVIASMGPGTFTSGGHYIVLSGLSADGTKIKVLDPGRESRNGEYEVSKIMGQAKNFWAYSV